MSPVLVFGGFAVLLLAWLLSRSRNAREGSVPLPVVAAILVAFGAIVAGALAASGPRRVSPPPAVATMTESAPATGNALQPGVKAPKVSAAGWVNGPPSSKPGIRAIDVWAPWCLVCRDMAPGLVRAHERYAPRGVQFISLTDMSRSAVDGFVDHFDIPWSSGYGAPKATISAFRALRPGVTDAYRQVSPTLYIVDERGVVLWTDDAGRYRHENVDELLQQLYEQLDIALAGSGPGGPQARRQILERAQARSSS